MSYPKFFIKFEKFRFCFKERLFDYLIVKIATQTAKNNQTILQMFDAEIYSF